MASSSISDWNNLYAQVKAAGLLSSKTMTGNIVQDYSDLMTGTSRYMGYTQADIIKIQKQMKKESVYIDNMNILINNDELIEFRIMMDRAARLYNGSVGARVLFTGAFEDDNIILDTLSQWRTHNVRQYIFKDETSAYFEIFRKCSDTIAGHVNLIVDSMEYHLDIHRITGIGLTRPYTGVPNNGAATIDNLHGELLDFVDDYMIDDNGL